MSTFENIAVPFRTKGNRQYLDSVQMVEQPWLADFVKSFPNCFEFAINEDRAYFYPEGDAPNHNPS